MFLWGEKGGSAQHSETFRTRGVKPSRYWDRTPLGTVQREKVKKSKSSNKKSARTGS